MNFKTFAEYLNKIETTPSRNEIAIILAELFANLKISEFRKSMYLLQGRIAPLYNPIEFNFSTKLILKSLDGITNSVFVDPSQENAENLFKQYGDIGLVAEKMLAGKSTETNTEHSVSEIFDKLKEIADTTGSGSQGMKIEKFQALVKSLSPIEGKYIGRIVVGKLRLGLSEKTIFDGLSWYKSGDKSLRDLIERVYGIRSDIGQVGEFVMQTKASELGEALDKLSIEPGTPVASKLVEREKSATAVFERTKACIAQPKLDGLRAQLHLYTNAEGIKESQIFSRNMENMTHMFPDLEEYLKKLKYDSIVLDSEAIGIDFKTGNYLPFQSTIQRKRKHDVGDKSSEIPVRAQVFDVLFLNGKDISREPLEKRVEILKSLELNISSQPLLELLDTQEINTEDELQRYFTMNVEKGLEGIIVKKFGTYYEPGTRNYDWIKLKASSQSDLVDTVDAVVMGYYHGTGTRSKFGIGAILVGIYDDADGKFKTVAKVGTGITEELLQKMKSELDQIVSKDQPENFVISKTLLPDVFVNPQVVVEVEADEITRSKMHTASIDKDGNGLSMRFPRLKGWRIDKNEFQTTSPKELEKMFGL